TAVLLDKTGTITMGKPEVVRMSVCATVHAAGPERPGESGPFASRLAASLARHSSHPLSQAVAKLSEEEFKLNEWQEVRGAGVQGIWTSEKGDASMVRLGSLKWLAENGVDLTAGNAFAEEWTARGASVLGVAMDEELSALLAVADTLKPK